jgi:peroxiredoxin (alkyl hydroperoxide reductase subunit C)
VIYFYPKDFTFICPTEIAEMDRLTDEGVHVIGISGDNEFCKQNWKQTNDLIKDVRHPLAADCGLKLSTELGVVDADEGVCLRATFILNSEGVIQHVTVNALDTGRSADETIRTLKALQAGGLTGCSWNPGDEFVA